MIKNIKITILFILVFMSTYLVPAHAYVGPGIELSFIGTLIGVALTLLAAIGAILWWPIRSFFRWAREKSGKEIDDKKK